MALSFSIALLVRHHSNGSVTVEVVGEPDLCAWGLELEDLTEDLELALIDRIERSHASLLHRYEAPRGTEHIAVPVTALTELQADPPRPYSGDVDVVLEPEGTWRRLWIPKLNARLWVDAEQDLETEVAAFVTKALEGATIEKRLEMRPEAGMSLKRLVLEVEPAPLVSFTGDNAGKMLLPEPIPESEKKEEAEAKKKKPTPMLDSLAMESTADPEALTQAHGRETEVGELLRMLARPGAVVVVVGPPTTGKSTVIDTVLKGLAANEKRAWFLDASRLVTSDPFTGWREQTLTALHELGESDDVWVCGDPIDLLDAGKHVGSEMNVAQLLKPFLSAGNLRVLGECSEATWARMEARDAGFTRLFTPYRMTEPPPEVSRAVLDAVAADLPLPVTTDGLDAALELSRRYGPADALLGTTCHFLRRTVAEARARGVKRELGRVQILKRFCAETGLPEILLRDELTLDPDAVRDSFRTRLVGQDEALDSMVDLIAIIKAGMSDLGRPLGSFLFVGPTGVGKTETAKALAGWLFGHEDRLLRFDMSEYSGPDCLNRLLDRDAGLVARVRQSPFCVVLLDEIEKAHGAVFDLLLQVLGEARLSDGTGRTADFRNAVVLMTSNLGVGSFRRPTGFGGDAAGALQHHVLAEVERFFRPELFNRIDRVIPFASLGATAIRGIAEREVDAVCRREGLKGQGVALDVDLEVVGFLADRGVDVQFGARPLKRAVQTLLVAPLARHLSEGGTPPRVQVQVDGGRLHFKNAEGEAKVAQDEALKGLLGRLSQLRFRAERWRASKTAVSVSREVKLVDRLMAGKRFWKEHEAATARSQAVTPLREAVEALDEAREQVLALEELAHESWLTQDRTAVEELVSQETQLRTVLAEAELGLAGCRIPNPHIGYLRLDPSEEASDFARRLLMAYFVLGAERGWKVRLESKKELCWPHKTLSLEAIVHRLKQIPVGVFVLRFEGTHAATLTAGETGGHVLKDGQGPKSIEVRATFTPPKEPKKGRDPLRAVRWYDTRKGHVRHPARKVQTTLKTRWEGAVLEMMRYHLYTRMLGDTLGYRLWKGTPWM